MYKFGWKSFVGSGVSDRSVCDRLIYNGEGGMRVGKARVILCMRCKCSAGAISALKLCDNWQDEVAEIYIRNFKKGIFMTQIVPEMFVADYIN